MKFLCDLRDSGYERAEDEDCESHEEKKIVSSWSVNVVWLRPNEKRLRRTGDEPSPCDEREDCPLAARREPEVDEVVVGFGSSFGGQKWGLF